MKQFTSHLDFKLASKRFGMMSRRTHWVNRISRKALLMPLLLALAATFCTQSEPEDWITYSVDLVSESYPSSKPYLNKVRVYKDKEGDLYTGIRYGHESETGILRIQEVFEEGLPVTSIRYYDDGHEHLRSNYKYSNGFLATYQSFVNDTLWLKIQYPVSETDCLTVYQQYHKNGQLRYQESYSKPYGMTKNGRAKYQGYMTLYDEEGNILEQELYADGKLVEKIK